MEALRDRLAAGVVERIPDVTLLGHPTERLPGNVAFSVRYVEGESMLLQLDARGFMVSSGSACASGSLEPSHVVLALGMRAEDAHGSMRISLGKGEHGRAGRCVPGGLPADRRQAAADEPAVRERLTRCTPTS